MFCGDCFCGTLPLRCVKDTINTVLHFSWEVTCYLNELHWRVCAEVVAFRVCLLERFLFCYIACTLFDVCMFVHGLLQEFTLKIYCLICCNSATIIFGFVWYYFICDVILIVMFV